MKLSIIIPTFNEPTIGTTLEHLRAVFGSSVEIVIADASTDNTTKSAAKPYANTIIPVAVPSRGDQLRVGALVAKGTHLLFLHTDMRLDQNIPQQIHDAINDPSFGYAAFAKKFDSHHLLLSMLSILNNWRSKTRAYIQGDNGLLVSKDFYDRIGGFRAMPLMEDLYMARRLKMFAKKQHLSFVFLPGPIIVSARFFQRHGVMRGILFIQWIKFLYSFGAKPHSLQKRYYAFAKTSSSHVR